MSFQNKTVFLTGASSGIGAGLALALAKRGAVVALAARRLELLEQLRSDCEAVGGTARVFPLDVSDSAAMRNAADEFRKEFGKIDIMIANAGIAGKGEKERSIDAEAVAHLINVNLIGAVNAVAAVLPEMLMAGSGHLVAISSLAGYRGLPRSAAYSASKAGMTAFFESLRVDHPPSGVDVTVIHPGFIRTPLTAARANKMPFLMELDDAIPHFMKAIEQRVAFAAFPWQLAAIVKLGKFMPAALYDKIARKARFRE